MNPKQRLARLAACLLIAAGSAHAAPPVVNPEPLDLDPDITAKLLKEKSKRSTIADGMRSGRSASAGGSSECGTVNINSNNNSKSNSGIREMFGKQSTTIVTGPVINAANCK